MSVVELVRRERTPDRPGPGPLRETQLRKLDLTVRRRVDALLVGDHRATTLGEGTELAQVRPYVVGDDVRRIDWNVTARTGEAHVRAHVAERTVNTWLLLDTSPSMTFGTADRRKWDVAEGVALAVGHVATRRGNRLGVATFGDADPVVSPGRGSRRGLLGLLHTLRREPSGEPTGTTSFGTACDRAAHLVRRRSLVVAVSDFRGPLDWRRALLRLAVGHEVVAVEIRDPREDELPNVGSVWLVDPETRQQLQVDTRDARVREQFAETAAGERQELARMFRSAGVPHVVVSTSGDWLRTLVRFLEIERRARR
ncbi:MAG: DUF58 domain-containing protein [Gaiellaceae bacterium]